MAIPRGYKHARSKRCRCGSPGAEIAEGRVFRLVLKGQRVQAGEPAYVWGLPGRGLCRHHRHLVAGGSMTAWNPVAPGVRSPLGAENGARAAPKNSRQSSARPLGAGAGPALRRLRAHPGSLADTGDSCVAEAESAAGGY